MTAYRLRWQHKPCTGRAARDQTGPIDGMMSHRACIRRVRPGMSEKHFINIGTYRTRDGIVPPREAQEFLCKAQDRMEAKFPTDGQIFTELENDLIEALSLHLAEA